MSPVLPACLAALATACAAAPSRAPVPMAARPGTVVLVAGGDVLLDRGVGRAIDRHGPDFPFARLAPWLQGADLAFANLEGPVGDACVPQVKDFVFRGRPGGDAALARAGLDVAALANNHGLDCGPAGVAGSRAALAAAGVAACGAGDGAEAAARPVVLERRGLRVAFACFTDFPPPSLVLPEEGPTLAQALPDRVATAVATARGAADVVVVSFHWGREYLLEPDDRQRELAGLAAAAGADVVLGHHPHVLQGFEVLPGRAGRRTLVAWSLGNLVFDQHGPETARSVLLRVALGPGGFEAAEALPVRIAGMQPAVTGPAVPVPRVDRPAP